MKILFSGYHNPHFLTVTEYIENAITELGHELYVFDDRQHIIPGRIRSRIKYFNQIDLQYINHKFLSLALKAKPDIIIVSGGHRITSSALKRLAKAGLCVTLWTLDAPLNFQPIIKSAPFYNLIFCMGTEAIELLRDTGIKGAHWLPAACDSVHHHHLELSIQDQEKYGYDVAFVGSFYPSRAEILEGLSHFNIAIWGPGWDRLPAQSPLRPFVKGEHTKPDIWRKIYNASKIILSIHYQELEKCFPVYQASPRVFEALACGAFIITDSQRDVLSLFNDGEHLVAFSDKIDLQKKVEYFLGRPQERFRISSTGRQEVLAKHTYINRIENLLYLVNAASPLYHQAAV